MIFFSIKINATTENKNVQIHIVHKEFRDETWTSMSEANAIIEQQIVIFVEKIISLG